MFNLKNHIDKVFGQNLECFNYDCLNKVIVIKIKNGHVLRFTRVKMLLSYCNDVNLDPWDYYEITDVITNEYTIKIIGNCNHEDKPNFILDIWETTIYIKAEQCYIDDVEILLNK